MKIELLNTIKLDHLPSGSGIVKSGESYYIVGDDSPFLFNLNKEFEVISKTRLLDAFNFPDERIIKSEKPDFEALEMVGDHEIVVFGSGSKSPQRNIFIQILLKDSLTIETYDSSEFYNHLKELPELKDSELNIEAAAYHNDHIFLFNRNKNLIIKFIYKEFLGFIKGEKAFPKLVIKAFSLPKINGIEAGFSGATTLSNEAKIIFTASVEDTDNAYDDGEILGSFIGMIDISNNTISNRFKYCEIPNTDENLKVESVTIEEEVSPGKTKVVLITDDDLGNSILIEALLSW